MTTSASLDDACFAKSAIICPAATVHLLVLFSAGSLFSFTSPVMLKSATVSTSHSERGHKGTGCYNLISTSRLQAGFLHFTHRPWADAAFSAHTGSARPQ